MKKDDFYNKEFRYSNSSITRGELESLPFPFCTDDVDDATMQEIIEEAHMETADCWRLPADAPLDFDNDCISETWWEVLEEQCCRHMPYYEDIEGDEPFVTPEEEELYHHGLNADK